MARPYSLTSNTFELCNAIASNLQKTVINITKRDTFMIANEPLSLSHTNNVIMDMTGYYNLFAELGMK